MYEWFDPHEARLAADELAERLYYAKRDSEYREQMLERSLAFHKGRADAQDKMIANIARGIAIAPLTMTTSSTDTPLFVAPTAHPR